MIPRSKQPNDFDYSSDAQGGLEESDMEWSSSAEAEAALFSFIDYMDETGSGGGQPVAEGRGVSPADFSAEDLGLARDLQDLFPLEQEQLPPRFIQTITSQSDWIAPTNLEQRVRYRVFQRLHMPRRLFGETMPLPAGSSRGISLGRAPRMVALSTVLALVMLSLVTVAPSFAQGLRLLLGHTGVQVAPQYPRQMLVPQEQVQYLSPQAARRAVPFHIYWPGPTPGAYQFQGLVLHMGQLWADGPVVEVQYQLSESWGYEQLLVREFRPAAGSTVLQVVASGAAHAARVGGQPAIYIDGQWVQGRQGVVWKYGTRAELLYQFNGLIFWITADQRDGASQQMLEDMAQGLELMYLGQPHPRMADLLQPPLAQVAAALSPASLGEVIALIPAGISAQTGAAVYIALGSPPEDDR
jgi:hypothetical protein